MATLTVASAAGTPQTLDALVVGVLPGPDRPVLAGGSGAADRACEGRLVHMLKVLGASGSAEEITLVPAAADSPVPLVAAAGLGDPSGADGRILPEVLRKVAGAAVRALAGRERIGMTLALANDPVGKSDARAVGEGALLAAYEFARYR